MLDVSSIKRVSESLHWSSDINQLYHPTGSFVPESQNIVYSFGNVNTTKFTPILLKEWFFLLENGGYLVVDYRPNKLLGFHELEKQMWWLLKGGYEIVYHGEVSDSELRDLDERKLRAFINAKKESDLSTTITKTHGPHGYLRFVCRKTKKILLADDNIDKWTFGIITNGKRLDWLEEIIASIKKQNIPNYEIIICGKYHERKEKNIRYIPFSQRDDLGWITRKKNIILENAQYNNVCIMHDRMVLKENWYDGMKKWGNCFEILGCRQLYKDERVNDWIVQHNYINKGNKEFYSVSSSADYKDWYPTIWLLGQFYILKKSMSVWLDETVYYGQSEDYLFSQELNEQGFIHRFNFHASVSTLTHKYIKPTITKFSDTSLMPEMQLDGGNAYLKYSTYLGLKGLSFLRIYPSQQSLAILSKTVYSLILSLSPQKKKDLRESQLVNKK